jgi:hypothetical protein
MPAIRLPSGWMPGAMTLRAYLPREELRDGRYRLPAVTKVA